MEKARRHLAALSCCLTFLIASLTLAGWALGIPALKSVAPGFITMKANTAVGLGFLAIAYSLILLRRPSRGGLAAIFFAAIPGVLGLLTLGEHFFSVDLLVDELLFKDADFLVNHFRAGRMAPITAIGFVILSASTALGQNPWKRFARVSQFLGFTVLVISLQGLVSTVCGNSSLFGHTFNMQMAIHAGVAFIALSLAQFCLEPDDGFVELLWAKTAMGKTARSLVASVILLNPALNIFLFAADRYNLFTQDSAALMRGTFGMMILTVIILKNVSALQRAAKAQEDKDHRLHDALLSQKKILNFAPVILWATDEQGIFTHQEGRGLESLGISPGAFVGKSIFSYNAPGSIMIEAFLRAQAGQPATCVDEYSQREYETVITPHFGADGKVKEIIGVSLDTTHRRAAAQEKERRVQATIAKEAAEEATKSKSMFLANMSHEVRTPINGIMGMTWILLETELNEEQRDCGERIRASGEALLRIVNDILDLTKVESGHMTMEMREFSVPGMVFEAVRAMEVNAKARKLHLRTSGLEQVPLKLMGDGGRINQVLVNLISNAIKFTATGGVDVRIRTLSDTDASATLRFEVSDTGIGVPAASRQRIFQDFEQADSSTTRKFGGTGLGLSICKKLVELMGGQIGLDTVDGQGATFWFELELPKTGSAVKALPSAAPTSSRRATRSLKVLVADDNDVNQRVIQRMLVRMGHDSLLVNNGREALDELTRGSFDVVLMDCHMPVLDGYDATRAIRQELRRSPSELPIIALTANAMESNLKRCEEAGMNTMLPKPYTYEQLLELLDDVSSMVKSDAA